MPQVPAPVRRERAARLRALGQTVKTRFLDTRLGCQAIVLVERDGGGHSEHFAPAVVAGAEVAPGDLVHGRVAGVAEGRLVVLPSAA
jgi:threonylcarbamoyladenosine tRNA methylthiotransferase MtaB